jgi:hypothetical protein
MTIKPSGDPLSFSDITREFGTPPGKNIGAYRRNESVGSLSGLRLDTGIPGPGEPIRFSDFYGKRLNVVVDLYSVPENSTRLIIKNRYQSNDAVTIIGGFKQPVDLPPDGDGKRIIANVNKTIGSEKTGRNYCALRTGTWGTDVGLEIVVGPAGTIIGAGGDGGRGGGPGDGTNGGSGSSALGIQYPTRVINQGVIFAGRGGGGGGAVGGGYEYNNVQSCGAPLPNQPKAGGGGGGGGRGLPGGTGGAANNYTFKRGGGPVNTASQSGQSGTINSSGDGGAGSVNIPNDTSRCSPQTGTGGAGGSAGQSGGTGTVTNLTNPGQAGTNGYAIIKSNNDYIIGDVPSVDGDIVTSTVQ